MILTKNVTFADAEVYDPIIEQAYSGYRTYVESGVNYGESSGALSDVPKGATLYFAHQICIPRDVTLKLGHPFIIRSLDGKIQIFGILVSFSQEPNVPIPISAEFGMTGTPDKLTYSWNHYKYHLVFSKLSPLDFFSVVDGAKNLYEHQTKKASEKSSL